MLSVDHQPLAFPSAFLRNLHLCLLSLYSIPLGDLTPKATLRLRPRFVSLALKADVEVDTSGTFRHRPIDQ